jgi:hypothetical protein
LGGSRNPRPLEAIPLGGMGIHGGKTGLELEDESNNIGRISMSLANYLRLLRDMGHRVVETSSASWSNVSTGMYMNFPLHHPIEPSTSEIRQVLGLTGIAVRYTCPIEVGRASYALVCSDKNYDLSSLPQKGRNRTRRGLESCFVRKIAWDELESVGAIRVARDTRDRQARAIPPNHDDYWRRYFSAAAKLDTMEAWGAFVGSQLAAFITASTIEDRIYIWTLNSDREYLSANPNNALFFVFVKDAIARSGIVEVSTGLESMQSDPSDLERFKLRMGFQRVPIGQRVAFNPLYSAILRGPILRKLRDSLSNGSNNATWTKLGVLLRWYSEQPAL